MLEQLLHTDIGVYSLLALGATVLMVLVASALILKAQSDERKQRAEGDAGKP